MVAPYVLMQSIAAQEAQHETETLLYTLFCAEQELRYSKVVIVFVL
jgi:hypothetical protein